MSAVYVRPEAVTAWTNLGAVLTDLRASGASVPCWVDPDPFTSEDPAERREAATACQWCPALPACRLFAATNGETAHVWAGIDRTPKASPKRSTGSRKAPAA